MSLPIIYSAHHASYNFGDFSDRVQLTTEQRKRYSDLGTEITVPHNGYKTLLSEYSRGLIDLNRSPESTSLFPVVDFAKPTPHQIFYENDGLTDEEKLYLKHSVYDKYHNDIFKGITQLDADCLVIAWDNTAHYEIGMNNAGENQMMVPFILSNNGDENSPDGSATTCSPELLKSVGDAFERELQARNLPAEIHYNLVFKGGYITQYYTNYHKDTVFDSNNLIQSFQVEYDMSITHDQETLQINMTKASLLKEAFTVAIESVFEYS